jgi:hypothetical protein
MATIRAAAREYAALKQSQLDEIGAGAGGGSTELVGPHLDAKGDSPPT